MSRYDRRTFIGTSVGAAAAGWSVAHAAESQQQGATPGQAIAGDVPRPPMIQLGHTGIKMSRLGQGTGVHGGDRQSDQTRMGFGDLVELFHHAYRRGIRFYDLADLYGTHIYFREALRTIPYGETRSYGYIAEQIGSPGAFRAVGLANGRNPIGIIVPCHRVIGANGSLTGYGGGLERKRILLELERGQTRS